MTKKDILDKLKYFKDDAKVRFMFWKKSGINAFDDDVQISSRFLNRQTGEMYDSNLGTNVDPSLFSTTYGAEPLDALIYMYSPEQAKDAFKETKRKATLRKNKL